MSSGRDPVARASKRLSFLLRHRPEEIGLELDHEGWAEIDELLRLDGRLTRELLHAAVATNDKQRFAVSEDGRRIRARQGHSIDVDLRLEARAPPEELWHGTHPGAVDAIRGDGLRKMARQHVHLSADRDTARRAGGRRGRPVLLRVAAAAMCAEGHAFYLSENGVWLTDAVPPEFLSDA